MRIFYKTLIILYLFLVSLIASYLAYDKWIKQPAPLWGLEEFDYWEHEVVPGLSQKAIELARNRYLSSIRLVLEDVDGYVNYIGWEARPTEPLSFFRSYQPYANYSYIVSCTYETPETIAEDKIHGWWWHVILRDTIVRPLKPKEWERGLALADSILHKQKD